MCYKAGNTFQQRCLSFELVYFEIITGRAQALLESFLGSMAHLNEYLEIFTFASISRIRNKLKL